MKVSDKNFEIAQACQKQYWVQNWEKDVDRQRLARIRWERLITILRGQIHLSPDSHILDLGCGPCGIIGALDVGVRFGIDPLMDYYLSHFEMPRGVKWMKGIGEELPFENEYFDLVITMDTLDHVKNPETVLREARRVLKKDGTLFLTVNISKPLTRTIKNIHQKLSISSPAELHFFTAKQIEQLLSRLGFKAKKSWHDVIDLEATTGSATGFITNLKKTLKKTTRIAREGGLWEGLKFIISFLTGGRSYQGDFLIIAAKQEPT